ncbi:MAG: response regulator [Chloroflexi bacterium]|nr:response regulator [Chloroflexota bacterium]
MRKTVLVVDDELPVRSLIRRALEMGTYAVLEARDGEEGLEIARERHPDLVLLDIRMPKLDGHEVCRRLKADPSTAHVEVVMVSGNSDPESVQRSLDAGAFAFLSKPFRITELLDTVEKALGNGREVE